MGNVCKTCSRPDRAQIDAAIVAGEGLRPIADRCGIPLTSLKRHARHMSGAGVALVAVREEVAQLEQERAALNITETLGTMMDRARKLGDAADEWLTHPEDPSRYELGARGDEVWVTVETLVPNESGRGTRTVRERRPLSHWIEDIERGTSGTVVRVESKHADPRKLVIEANDSALRVIETVTSLIAQNFELQSKLDAAAKIGALPRPEIERRLRYYLTDVCGMSERAFEALLAAFDAGVKRKALEDAEAEDESG